MTTNLFAQSPGDENYEDDIKGATISNDGWDYYTNDTGATLRIFDTMDFTGLSYNFESDGANAQTEVGFKSTDGSEFKLQSFDIGRGFGTFDNLTVRGFRDGSEVASAAPAPTGNSFIFDKSSDIQWANIDEIRINGDDLWIELDNIDIDAAVTNTAPIVTTSSATSITATEATLSGNVTDDGGDTITERGFVYGTSINPTIGDGRSTRLQDGTGTGIFEEAITGLTVETNYYVRAYAINGEGTSYGSEEGFVTSAESSTFAGGDGTEADPYQVETAEQLDAVRNHREAYFIQTADIDLGVSPWNDGEGWVPIGTTSGGLNFLGTFDGNGYTISNLSLDREESMEQGLFGFTNRATLENIAIKNASVSAKSYVGLLVGNGNETTISNSYATGIVTGTDGDVGGLVGSLGMSSNMTNSYSTASVNGYSDVGGLVGSMSDMSDITSSYATGTVTGADYSVGGLVGSIQMNGNITNSYSTASVNAVSFVGGLVGFLDMGSVTNSYATGAVTGAGSDVGGLVGMSMGMVTSSFWDTETTGQSTSNGGGTGKTTAEMKAATTFTNASWDFSTIWQTGEPQGSNNTYPYLQNNTQDPAPGYSGPQSPEVVTNTTIENITSESASLSGEVTNDGGEPVTERGFVYNTSTAPTITDNKVQSGEGTGVFSEAISGLASGTSYFVRAYAINDQGTSYGSEESFTTLSKPAFTSTPITEVDYEQLYSYRLTASKGGDLSTTISATTLPDWLSLSAEAQSEATEIGNIPGTATISGAAVDDNGNFYAITFSGTIIYKVEPDGTTSEWATGLINGDVHALHVAGDYIYIPRYSNSAESITRIPLENPGAGEEVFASFDNGATSLTDHGDWIYAAVLDRNEIKRIHKSDKTVETFLTTEDGILGEGPFGLDFDSEGNLFIASLHNHTIIKYDGIDITTAITNLPNAVTSVVVNESGNFYVSMLNGGVRKYKSDWSDYSNVSQSETDNVISLSITSTGELVYTLFQTNHVYQLKTGTVLSGIPAKSDVGTHPVVLEASNTVGSTQQTFSIDVQDNVAPVVQTYSPANSATDVAVQPSLSLTFDEEITLGNEGFFNINDGNTDVLSYDLSVTEDRDQFSLSGDNKTLNISISDRLPNNIGLSVELQNGSTGNIVEDTHGNAFEGFLASSDTWTFTTIANQPPDASNVSISGDLIYDQELTGSYEYADAENDDESGTTLQWYRSDDAAGTNRSAITDSTNSTYTPGKDDIGKYLSFEVTPNDRNAFGSAVETDFSGPVASPFAAGEGTEASPYEIATAEQLDYARDFLDMHFEQTADIDLGISPWNNGNSWEPIGTLEDRFTGSYDGNGNTISNLFIDRPTQDYVGLIGATSPGASVNNLQLENADVTGRDRTGGLIGESRGDVSNVSVSGSVTGTKYIGGIFGIVESNSVVSSSYSTADVTGSLRIGGLTGYIYGTLENSYVVGGTVDGSMESGGLIGTAFQATVTNTYSANTVVDANPIFGNNINGESVFTNNFWDADVTGLLPSDEGTGLPSEDFKTKSTFTDAGWDLESVWKIDEPGSGSISYPYLQVNPQDPTPGNLTVTVPVVSTGTDITSITDSSAIAGGEISDDGNLTIADRGFVWSVAMNPDINDNVASLGTGSGNFSKTVENLPPGTTIYLRAYATNQLGTSYGSEKSFKTEKQELTISGSFSVSNKVYDGNTTAVTEENNLKLNDVFTGHDVTLTGIDVEFAYANAGSAIPVSIVSVVLSGDDSERYTLSLTNSPTASANITARPITITAAPVSIIYGDVDPVLSYKISSGSLVKGEELSGSLSRISGQNVGAYAIQQGTLSAGTNYNLTYVGADLSILRTPPVVVQHSPGVDEERVALDAVLTAEFDHEITVADATLITLTDPDATAIPLTVSANGSVLTLRHGGLSHHTEYTLAIGKRALENVDGIGNKTAKWSFTTVMSAPVAENPTPVDGATHVGVNDMLSVTFSQDVTLADASGISIVSAQGGSPADLRAELSDNVLTITHGGLDYLTEYTISVPQGTVQNTDGVGNESVSWRFTSIVPVPDPVVLTAPVDQQGMVDLNSEFEWEPTPHAEHYRIQVSDAETFDAPLEDVDQLTELTFTPAEPLSDYQTYFWRVKAANDAGESEWSDVDRFTTIANKPSAIFPLMDSQNISIAPMPEWKSGYQTAYRVQLGTTSGFEALVADSLTTNMSVQITGLEEDAEYYWRVRIETDSTESSWTDALRFRTRPAASTEDDVQVVDHSVTFGETSNQQERVISELDYRMVGLPGNNHHGVEEFFVGKYGRDWKVFYENGNDTKYYDEYKQGDDRFVFAPGRGFWVLSTDVMNLDLKITSVPTNEHDAYSVSLHPGWNIITNPHRGPVSWTDVQEMNDFNGDAWGYEQRFVLADTLHPVQGYYVYNRPDQPRDYLDIPYANMEQRRSEERGKVLMAAKSMTSIPAINLSAQFEDNGRFDTQIVYPDLAGTRNDGDALDDASLRRYYPSLEMSRSGMMLVNDDQISRGGLLREVSRFDAEGTELELHMKGETGESFSWILNLEQMPAQTRVLIVNRANSRTWLLKDGEEVETTLTEPNAVYDLYTGDRDRLEQLQKDMMPQEFALEPNYPNPFNPITNIRYSIPSQQHVKLEVYDVIGRRVKVLTNNVQQAGWHVAQFDASTLASGVYLYRLTTDSNVKVRKMTLVK